MGKWTVAFAFFMIVLVLGAVLFIEFNVPAFTEDTEVKDETYVGVTYGGDSVAEGKLLIDKVKGYTNLFSLQSGTLQRHLDSVTELGDYAVSNGLRFLPYFGSYLSPSLHGWIEEATQRWGSYFLGVYYYDEPAGKMLDDYVEFQDPNTNNTIMKTRYGDVVVQKPNGVVVHYEISGITHLHEPAGLGENSSFIDAASNLTPTKDVYATFYPNGTINIAESNLATENITGSNWHSIVTYEDLISQRPFTDVNEIAQHFYARDQTNIQYLTNCTKIFTSDYALYWFDYLSGYDVVFAQLGWNNSLPQNIALIRGAANLQNKEWGAIITWKYTTEPYLDNATEIFNQMHTAYACGAKYLLLFNYYADNSGPYGTLTEEHFSTLDAFWNKCINTNNDTYNSIQATELLILPKNYGSGMRWQNDRIWGVIEPNETSHKIWNTLQKNLTNNTLHLDIIYDDPNFPPNNQYNHISYWNQTK